MIFLQAPSHPGLKNYIHQYWYLQTDNPEEFGNLKQMMFPIDFSAMSFYWANNLPEIEHLKNQIKRQTEILYTGLITSPGSITFYPNEPLEGFVVAFLPHGFADLFGFDNSTVTDHLPNFYSINEKDGKWLYDKVKRAPDFESKCEVVNQYFLARLPSENHTAQMIDAVDKIVNSNGLIDMMQLAKEVSMSWSSLERHFKKRIGVSPKMYARFKRFHYSLELLNNQPSMSWLEIAHACGYFDQAHFIREFRKFTNKLPSAFSVMDYPLFYRFIIHKK